MIAEVALKLNGQPEAISPAICDFDTVALVINSENSIIQIGIHIAHVELINTKNALTVLLIQERTSQTAHI